MRLPIVAVLFIAATSPAGAVHICQRESDGFVYPCITVIVDPVRPIGDVHPPSGPVDAPLSCAQALNIVERQHVSLGTMMKLGLCELDLRAE